MTKKSIRLMVEALLMLIGITSLFSILVSLMQGEEYASLAVLGCMTYCLGTQLIARFAGQHVGS